MSVDWRPIDTADKVHAARLLGVADGEVTIISWSDTRKCWVDLVTGRGRCATLWAPLPELPVW